MRRMDRSISESEAFEILNQGEYGYLSTVSAEGDPYGVPLNYANTRDSLYFHCASDGQKLDNLRVHPGVSFAVVGATEILPSSFGTLYESVLVYGTAEEVEGEEKQQALELFLDKYSVEFRKTGIQYIKAMYAKTIVVAIRIESVSGKARKS